MRSGSAQVLTGHAHAIAAEASWNGGPLARFPWQSVPTQIMTGTLKGDCKLAHMFSKIFTLPSLE